MTRDGRLVLSVTEAAGMLGISRGLAHELVPEASCRACDWAGASSCPGGRWRRCSRSGSPNPWIPWREAKSDVRRGLSALTRSPATTANPPSNNDTEPTPITPTHQRTYHHHEPSPTTLQPPRISTPPQQSHQSTDALAPGVRGGRDRGGVCRTARLSTVSEPC